jgi:glyoxylase-like metal-dependent hydrolase (beta-lactamase superfamily II)
VIPTRAATRRDWLRGLGALFATVALPTRGFGQGALEVLDIDTGLAIVRGAGANITVAEGRGELLLVDSGLAPRASELIALLDTRWPGKPVSTVFNTNWRPEHTGNNGPLRAAGARVFAHENTKLWMGARFEVPWQAEKHLPRSPAELPNYTFYESGEIDFGDETVGYGYVPRAHTDGDIYVHFPARDTLVVSDLLAVGGYPIPDYATGGWIGGMKDATESLLALSKPTTRIVAADGAVQRTETLGTQLLLCERVLRQVALSYRSGGSLQDFLNTEPAAEFVAERGDPRLFLELVYEGAFYYSRQLGGVI